MHANKQQKLEKKHRKKYSSNNHLNYQTADKQPQSYVDKCEQIIFAARNYMHAKLHTPLLTMSNFTQQIITSTKFSF